MCCLPFRTRDSTRDLFVFVFVLLLCNKSSSFFFSIASLLFPFFQLFFHSIVVLWMSKRVAFDGRFSQFLIHFYFLIYLCVILFTHATLIFNSIAVFPSIPHAHTPIPSYILNIYYSKEDEKKSCSAAATTAAASVSYKRIFSHCFPFVLE